MEIVALSSSSDQKIRIKSLKSDNLRRPITLLKDFMLEDFSSCSSNGFKSFPRKAHCCSASVPLFLLDGDLKGRASSSSKRHRLSRNPSKAASATFSALHRASLKVLHKLLPYRPAVKSSSAGSAHRGAYRGILPRSLSRKLSKTWFWKKTAAAAVGVAESDDSVTGRWKMFREFLEEKDPPPPSDKISHRSSMSVTSSSSGRNSSWDSSDFVSSTASSNSFSVNSVSSTALSDGKKDSTLPPHLEQEEDVTDRVGVTVGVEESGAAATTECSKEEWQCEEKEQFSPVSVLDCPFNDDEEIEIETEIEFASHSSYSSAHIRGTKHKHKVCRFKNLSQLDPMNLNQRLADAKLKNHMTEPFGFGAEAEDMLRAMKAKYPSLGLGVDNLLSDFFMERLEDGLRHDTFNLADDWVSGREEVWLGWEIVKGRNAYLRDMEKGEVWMKLKGEKQEVVSELEVEIWSGLVEEILLGL